MSQYRICRNKTFSYQHHLKSTFFHKLSSSSSKDFWSLFKKLNKKSSSIPTLSFNGSSATTPLTKANMINQFFVNCFNVSVPPLSTASGDSGSSEECPSHFLCSNVKVAKLLLQIPFNTSTGPDGISARMLRETAYSISSPLTSIFNLSIKSGIFHDNWKNSHVIPTPKHSSAPSSPRGYHPISLLPLISKVLERHIFNWLLDFCQTHNLLSDSQFGFRPGHSTEFALITSTNLWFTQMDKGYSICATFVDLTKSFDSVPHQPLLDVLFSLDILHHLMVGFKAISQFDLSRLLLIAVPLLSLLSYLAFLKAPFLDHFSSFCM